MPLTLKEAALVVGMILCLLAGYIGMGLVQDWTRVDHPSGITWSHGVVVETHGSESYLGNSVGRLKEYNGDPNRLSTICDFTLNGEHDIQRIYNRDGAEVNRTRDPDGYGGDCGREVLDMSRSGHQVTAEVGGTLSVH